MIIAELGPVSSDPGTREPVTVNFDTVLEPGREKLTSVVWTCPTLTLGSGAYGPAISADGRRTTIWLQGGPAGRHELTCTYTTDHSPPRIDVVQVGVTLV